jgi:hypothetical protein
LKPPCAATSRTRYRLVGVGLGNFRDAQELLPQPELFGG